MYACTKCCRQRGTYSVTFETKSPLGAMQKTLLDKDLLTISIIDGAACYELKGLSRVACTTYGPFNSFTKTLKRNQRDAQSNSGSC